MTDRDALFRAVLAHPDDDTPRLVLADWLDDHGDAADRDRAAFIRVGCEMARSDPWGHAFRQLRERAYWLERKYETAWEASLDGTGIRHARFARGFVEEVTIGAKRFLAEGDSLFDREPIRAVKFVTMTGGSGTVPPKQLFASPLLARLHTFELVGPDVDDSYVDALVASPHVAGLRTLRLNGCTISPAGLGVLLKAKTLPALRELDFSGLHSDQAPTVESDHAVALAKSPGLARIKVLDLQGTAVGAEGVRALAGSRHAAGLEVLRLGFIGRTGALRADAATILPQSPHLKNLRELKIRGHELRKRGGEAFATAANWPHLKSLSLRGNELPASVVPLLAANPSLLSLAELDLTGNAIRGADTDPLRAALPDTLIVLE